MAFSTHKCLYAPKQYVRSSALYMSLFSKHCSSHYHHHMLLALSSLISASAHSHLGRDGESELGGGPRRSVCREIPQRCRQICYRKKTRGAKSLPKTDRISGSDSHEGWPLNRYERDAEKPYYWKVCRGKWRREMIAERIAYLPLIVPPWAFESTMVSAAPFYD